MMKVVRIHALKAAQEKIIALQVRLIDSMHTHNMHFFDFPDLDDDEYEPFRSCKSKRKRPRRVPKKRTTKKTAPSSTASTSKNPVFILDSEEVGLIFLYRL